MVSIDDVFDGLGTDPGDAVEAMIDAVGQIANRKPAWHRDALCKEYELALWFPGIGERSDPALQICGRCLVIDECLAEALDDETLDHGIRGGMTAQARKQRRKTNGTTS